MQTVSSAFTTKTDAALRKIFTSVQISFLKNYDAGIDFFTIGVSSIGGSDVIKGTGSVIQEWDKYDYEDYSSRVLSVEVNRETQPPTNPLTFATCDIVLDNHDDLFTPSNTSSPLNGSLLSRRPVRVNVGFSQDELIPKFVGVTDGKPEIDERAKTAKFHCIDFLKSIMGTPLDEEVILQDYRTDEAISYLLENKGGLDPTQFNLDTGSVIIPFIYFPKGMQLGNALGDIAEAELGNLSILEDGTPRFQNRTSWASHTIAWEFTKRNLLERNSVDNNTIINVVNVYSRARQVQAKQKLWESAGIIELAPSGNTEVFIDFKDDYGALPVTSADDPDYIDSATTSLYATNEVIDGSGATRSTDVALVSSDLFSTAMKLTFSNASTKTLYLTQLEIYATPAKVVNDIYIRVQDDTSVGNKDGVEEHPVDINNDLIQDETAANSIAQILLDDRASEHDQEDWIVKAVPQLQIGDIGHYADDISDEEYFAIRINDIINSSGYRQKLTVSKRTMNVYFRIGISSIGGTDKIAP
jgi:hypothetical protein